LNSPDVRVVLPIREGREGDLAAKTSSRCLVSRINGKAIARSLDSEISEIFHLSTFVREAEMWVNGVRARGFPVASATDLPGHYFSFLSSQLGTRKMFTRRRCIPLVAGTATDFQRISHR